MSFDSRLRVADWTRHRSIRGQENRLLYRWFLSMIYKNHNYNNMTANGLIMGIRANSIPHGTIRRPLLFKKNSYTSVYAKLLVLYEFFIKIPYEKK